MKDDLAQALLAKIMNWTEEDDAAERPYLQVMAAYKYDEYPYECEKYGFRWLPYP